MTLLDGDDRVTTTSGDPTSSQRQESSTTSTGSSTTTTGVTTTTAASSTTTTTTTAPTTTEATTTCTPPSTTTTTTTTIATSLVDVTSEGAAWATSRRCGAWDVRYAVDRDITTSWASGPMTDGTAMVTWTAAADILISSVELVSNAAHYDASFRTNHGFDLVLVDLIDSADEVVWEVLVDLQGTLDPDVVFGPEVVARTVQLTFIDPETSSTGGFAELRILTRR